MPTAHNVDTGTPPPRADRGSKPEPPHLMRKLIAVHVKTFCLATAVLALGSMGGSTGSRAAMLSGPDLLTACGGNATAKATCDGYLMAVTDAVLQRESRARGKGKLCVPETVTIDQVRESVMGFTKQAKAPAQPMTGAPALRLVTAALRTTWPCEDVPKKKGRSRRDGGQD